MKINQKIILSFLPLITDASTENLLAETDELVENTLANN